MEKYISALVISFFMYGVCGWVWESFFCPILTGNRIKNSGFLNGPIVPIYGVGAISVSLLFSQNDSYLSVFIEGAFVACVIEYITSWLMEAMYHERWWDYSDKAFNVNGRVCLEGFLIFGFFSVLAVKFVQPFLMKFLMGYTMVPLIVVSTALVTILIVDLTVTVITLAHLEERLDEFVRDIEDYAHKAFDEFEASKKNATEIVEAMKMNDDSYYQEWVKRKKYAEKRVLKAFPNLIKNKKK